MLVTIKARQAAILCGLLALNPYLHACDSSELDCLISDGQRLLERRDYEAAYLVFEKAAFLAPDHTSVRLGLGLVLQGMGASSITPPATPDSGLDSISRMETGIGYSNNRARQPNLNNLQLQLPEVGTVTLPLDSPLKADPGPVSWLNYQHVDTAGNLWQIGGARATDKNIGTAWMRAEGRLAQKHPWFWRVEHVRRLEAGWQTSGALRYRIGNGIGPALDGELALRQEHTQRNYQYADLRLSAQQGWREGGLALALHRYQPTGEKPPGEGQWRLSSTASHTWRVGIARISVLAALSHTRDDEAYHPYLAAGKPRWQQSAVFTTGFEYPLGQQLALWARAYAERQRSNIAFFDYTRLEALLGLGYQW